MNGTYVYIKSEPQIYTVGFYDPTGKWIPESDHTSSGQAADRVRFLNGGGEAKEPQLECGLTLRDYFAGQALAGLYSAHGQNGQWGAPGAEAQAATHAYAVADAMLEKRKR